MLGVLLAILAFNCVDRVALGLVLQNIKADLDLSDTQLGLLSGLAFALFYSLMGIPIARWADRGNRVLVIGVTTALWSAAVTACAAAGNFLQLLLIRVGVAVGESGCLPPANSLIADYFARSERPRAVAIYMLGSSLGLFIGYFGAGWLNELYGWRVTFVLLGLPGIALAALAWLTLKEPRRTSARIPQPAVSSAHAQPGLREVVVCLWRIVSFRQLLFFFAVGSFFATGVSQWQPTFFIRSYGLQTGELGTWFAVIWGLCSAAGTYLGGEWAFRHAAGNERRQLAGMALSYSSLSVNSVLMYLAPNHYLALTFMALGAIGSSLTFAPIYATIQTLVPERMRAMAVALLYLFANLVGMGLGPLATGALSDALQPWMQESSLRYALLAMSPGYLWGGWYLWRASQTVMRDLERARNESR